MRFYFVFLLCLACSQSGLSQNAGGMINRPQKNNRINKLEKSKSNIATLKNSNSLIAQFEGAYGFSEGLASVCHNRKWGYIDNTGHVAIPFKYESAGAFKDGFAPIKIEMITGTVPLIIFQQKLW